MSFRIEHSKKDIKKGYYYFNNNAELKLETMYRTTKK